MQLGKKKNVGVYDAINSEMAAAAEEAVPATIASTPTTTETPRSPATEGISVQFTENTVAKANRDGGVESMDVQGQLNLHISDSTLSRINLGLQTSDADGTQFKTHPNVDRNLFKDQNKIGLRDASRPFPLNQQMCVLRWRLQAKPENTTLPISGMSFLKICLFQSIFGLLPSAMGQQMSASNMKSMEVIPWQWKTLSSLFHCRYQDPCLTLEK